MKNIKKIILSVLVILLMIVGFVPLSTVMSSAASPTSLDFVIAGYAPGQLATGMNCYLNADKNPDMGNYIKVGYIGLYTNLSDAKLGWDSYDNEILYNTDYWLSIYITPKSGFNVNTVSTATLLGVQGATYVGMFNDSIKSNSIDGWFVVFKCPRVNSDTEETVKLILNGYGLGESLDLASGYEDANIGERKVWNEGSRVYFYTSVDKARLGDAPINGTNKFIANAQYYVCFNVESDNQFNIASLRNATLNISGARYEGTFRDTKNADRWNIIFKLPILDDDTDPKVDLHLDGYSLGADPTLVSWSEVKDEAASPKVEILTAEFYTSLETALVGEQGNAGYQFYSNTNYWVAFDVLPSSGYRVACSKFSLDISGAWCESVHAAPDGGSSWRIVFKLPTLSLEKTETLYFNLENYTVGASAAGIYATEIIDHRYGDYRVCLENYAVYRTLPDALRMTNAYEHNVYSDTMYWFVISLLPNYESFSLNSVDYATLSIGDSQFVSGYFEGIYRDPIDGEYWNVIFKLPELDSAEGETLNLGLDGYAKGEFESDITGSEIYDSATENERIYFDTVGIHTSLADALTGENYFNGEFTCGTEYWVSFIAGANDNFSLASVRNATLNVDGAILEGIYREPGTEFEDWNIIFKLPAIAHAPAADDGDCTTAILCSDCDTVITAASSGHIGGAATCTAKANCSVCNKEYGDFAAHTPTADDGDCTTAITCSVCGEVITAASSGHIGGTATCTAKAKCSVCNKEYGELAVHTDLDTNGKCDACGKDMSTTPGPDSTPEPSNEKDGLSGGAVAAIAIGSVLVAEIGVFSLVWFVIKKKSLAELLAIFKKK